MRGSIQDKLLRVRPPRVKITYDVETGGALEKRELPFIVGIFADLSGEPEKPLPLVKDRKLVEINRDNFNAVMKSAAPRMKLSGITDVLSEEAEHLSGFLTFASLMASDGSEDEFSPTSIVKRVPVTRVVYERRGRLRALQAKYEASDELAKLLDDAVSFDDNPKLSDEDNQKLRAERDALRAALTGAFQKEQGPEGWAQVAPSGEVEAVYKAMLTDPDEEPDPAQKAFLLSLVGQFTVDVVTGLEAPAPEAGHPTAANYMDDQVAVIDAALSEQLNLIMHAPAFQKLEATWRGLFYLVSRTETGPMLKLRILNVTWEELLKDMEKAAEFDQSAIFKKIYEAEYGTYGGEPYSLLMADYEFGRHPQHIKLLEKVSEIAAASHAPFIAAAYAKLFDLDSFEKLAKPRDLSMIFESLELNDWRSFRQSEDSRYVTLTLPRVLLRLPYGQETVPAEGFDFEEDVAGSLGCEPEAPAEGGEGEGEAAPKKPAPPPESRLKTPTRIDASTFLWGNSAWVLVERITHAFSLYGWTAAIRGTEGGGLVTGLPTYKFTTCEGDMEMVCPTQVTITDRREKELNDLGFMAICHCKGTNKAAFFGGQTTNQPKKYIVDLANSNAQISSMLPYMLAASRFAHYIKVIMRDKVGSFLTRGNVENFLNEWISQYVLLDDNATQEVKAAYPLRSAQVVVTEIPGKPGAYNATVFLKPHFQLEELTTSIRLVAELPA